MSLFEGSKKFIVFSFVLLFAFLPMVQDAPAAEDGDYYLSNARNRLRNPQYRLNDLQNLYDLDSSACVSYMKDIIVSKSEESVFRRRVLELFWSLEEEDAAAFCKKEIKKDGIDRGNRMLIMDFMIQKGVYDEKELWKIAKDKDEDVTVRNRVLAELYVRDEEEALKLIRKIVKDRFESAQARATFLNLLLQEDDSDIPKIVISILNSSDEDVEAKAAVIAIATFKGYREVVPTILKVLKNTAFLDWRLKVRALNALAKLGDTKIIPDLERLARYETNEMMRKKYEEVIEAIRTGKEEKEFGFSNRT